MDTNKIKLVVFDLAGTTLQDDGGVARAFAESMQASGYAVPNHRIQTMMGYKKPEAIQKLLAEATPANTSPTTELIDTIHHAFLHNMKTFYMDEPLTSTPNVREVFAYLKQQGIQVGINTGFSKDITKIVLDKLGWIEEDWVDAVISSDEVPEGRPAPYMIQALMEECGITDSKWVVKVGDTEVDVQEGKNAGCLLSIAVTTGAFTREALLPYAPDYIMDDLIELVPIIEKYR